MDIRHLRYFVSVAEHLSFSEAARQLHMSQPPLSQRIRELEMQLGTCLFRREAGRVDLTKEGEMLLPRARHLLQRHKAACMIMMTESSQQAPEPLNVVSCASMGSPAVLTTLELLSAAQLGQYRFNIVSPNECVEALHSGRAQLAVGPLPRSNENDPMSVVLYRESLAVALPHNHPLARSVKISFVDLVGERWLLPNCDDFPTLTHQFHLACRQIGLTPRISHQTVSSPEHALALVALGEGVSLVPEALVGAAVAKVRVAPLLRPRIFIDHSVQISQNPPQALKAVFQELRARVQRSNQRVA